MTTELVIAILVVAVVALAIKKFNNKKNEPIVATSYKIGTDYAFGRGIAEIDKLAAETYLQTAKSGSVEGYAALGHMYARGIHFAQDYEEAAKWYQLAADAGHATAIYGLADLLSDGRGVPKNEALAFELVKKAAELNEPSAQSSLGTLYELGKLGATQDPVQALSWYFKAAQAGNRLAQMKVGEAYFVGVGIKKDVGKGLEYLAKAAAQNQIGAIHSLALINKFGIDDFDSFVADNEQAFAWYLKGAELGDKVCEYQVGWSYLFGDGVAIDDAEAARWLLKAADKGNADAMFAVGIMYKSGRHFEQNTETAKHWYQQAAENGCESAKQELEKLA